MILSIPKITVFMNIPIYNCLINESLDDESGIYAISFVESPANEKDFIALSEQNTRIIFNKDSKKQILTGVVLSPDQLIYRNDQKLGEYYIKFSAEQIEKIAQKMMKKGIALHNTTHQHQDRLDGNYLAELWIVEDPQKDKSNALGFESLPKGTLMCSYKIEDKKYWDKEVMSGNVKGFSLEGYFMQQPENIKKRKLIKNGKMNKRKRKTGSLLSRINRFFLDIQAVEKADKTGSGTVYMIFTLEDGKEIYVDKDGFVTLDDEQLPSGEHILSDGNIMIVDEDGQLIETKEASTINSHPEQSIAPETLAKEEETDDEDEENEEEDDEKEPKGKNSIKALKAKIADLESKLSELATLAQEANTEVQALRRHTPSSRPLSTTGNYRKIAEMRRYEQIAQALSMSIRNKTNR